LFVLAHRADRTKLKLEIPSEPVVLDDILISLQSEINAEIEEMETEFEEGITCLTLIRNS